MNYTVYLNKGYSQEQLLIATGNRERAYEMAEKFRSKGIVEIFEARGLDLIQIEQYLD